MNHHDNLVLGAVALYLIATAIGAAIFHAIGSHICNRHSERRETESYERFLADATDAYKRGEI